MLKPALRSSVNARPRTSTPPPLSVPRGWVSTSAIRTSGYPKTCGTTYPLKRRLLETTTLPLCHNIARASTAKVPVLLPRHLVITLTAVCCYLLVAPSTHHGAGGEPHDAWVGLSLRYPLFLIIDSGLVSYSGSGASIQQCLNDRVDMFFVVRVGVLAPISPLGESEVFRDVVIFCLLLSFVFEIFLSLALSRRD